MRTSQSGRGVQMREDSAAGALVQHGRGFLWDLLEGAIDSLGPSAEFEDHKKGPQWVPLVLLTCPLPQALPDLEHEEVLPRAAALPLQGCCHTGDSTSVTAFSYGLTDRHASSPLSYK